MMEPSDSESLLDVGANSSIAPDPNSSGSNPIISNIKSLFGLGGKEALVDEVEASEADAVPESPPTKQTSASSTNATTVHMFKIAIVGALGCGKTSLVKRATGNREFSANVYPTAGISLQVCDSPFEKHCMSIHSESVGRSRERERERHWPVRTGP